MPPPLGLGNCQSAHAAGHAHVQLLAARGGLGHLRRDHLALGADDELRLHLAVQLRVLVEQALVAGADLRLVVLDDLADELLVQRALVDLEVRGRDGRVHALLAGEDGLLDAIVLVTADGPWWSAEADGVARATGAARAAASSPGRRSRPESPPRRRHVAHGALELLVQPRTLEERGDAALPGPLKRSFAMLCASSFLFGVGRVGGRLVRESCAAASSRWCWPAGRASAAAPPSAG